MLAGLRVRLDKAQARLEVAERVALSMASHVEARGDGVVAAPAVAKRRGGILGYGHLGAFLYRAIFDDPAVAAKLEVAFV